MHEYLVVVPLQLGWTGFIFLAFIGRASPPALLLPLAAFATADPAPHAVSAGVMLPPLQLLLLLLFTRCFSRVSSLGFVVFVCCVS